MRAGTLGLGNETRRRVDRAACADGDEQIARGERSIDAFHLPRHLPEPHHVGSHIAGHAAGRAVRREREVFRPRNAGAAAAHRARAKFAMHMDQLLAAGSLMQAVDILGHSKDVAFMVSFEPGQRNMSGVGLGHRL